MTKSIQHQYHTMDGRMFKRSAGLTMIEVLVTMAIMSIGLLSMAAMQLTGVRSVNSASLRTQATLIANDISERMRANPAALDNNLFMNVSSAAIDCTTLPSPYCGEYSTSSGTVIAAESCTSTQMATYDINVWFCGVNSAGAHAGGVMDYLPATDDGTPTATITCVDTNPPSGPDADPCTDTSPHVITVSWTEVNPTQDSDQPATITQSISMTVQPD